MNDSSLITLFRVKLGGESAGRMNNRIAFLILGTIFCCREMNCDASYITREERENTRALTYFPSHKSPGMNDFRS